MRPIRRQFCVAILAIFLFVYYLISLYSVSIKQKKLDLERIKRLRKSVYNPYKNTDNNCLLPKLDPWDPEIEKVFSDLGFQPKQCSPSLTLMTELKNGVLRTIWERSLFSWFAPSCYFRCLKPLNDYEMEEDEWKSIDNDNGVVPNCDIVETRCQKYFWFNYRFMHTQIIEKQPVVNQTNLSEYNFYWILIDSTSHSMFKRAMRQTHDVLVDKMKAIEFPYVNKVGLNSRPNAYSLFFGEQAFDIYATAFNNYTESKGRNINQLCPTELENLNFVGYDFQKSGFRTLMTEDWSLGVVNWPNCVGFKKPPVDHYLRPFWLKIGLEDAAKRKSSDLLMIYQMYMQACKEGHNYDLEHALQFIKSYSNKSKFAISWITQLAHDDNSVLFGVDHEFADFFEQIHEKAKNSFIFFQADHGIRSGKVRNIPIIGEIEDNNPFMYLVVPEKLRNNPTLMSQLKENSKHLISPFDLYSSAVQVAKFSHEWNTKTRFDQLPKSIVGREFIGSSIFHQMKQPRNCENLHIPWNYCICHKQSVDLDDPKLAKRAAQTIIDSINQQLDNSAHKDDCSRHTLSPDYSIRLEEYTQNDNNKRVLKVEFETLPGHALYQSFVQLNKDNSISLTETKFPRLNLYKFQAHCIAQSFYKNYCVCKDQAK